MLGWSEGTSDIFLGDEENVSMSRSSDIYKIRVKKKKRGMVEKGEWEKRKSKLVRKGKRKKERKKTQIRVKKEGKGKRK